jgi:hypothetical protein
MLPFRAFRPDSVPRMRPQTIGISGNRALFRGAALFRQAVAAISSLLPACNVLSNARAMGVTDYQSVKLIQQGRDSLPPATTLR